MKFQFRFADLAWLCIVVAILCGWWVDSARIYSPGYFWLSEFIPFHD